jgi:hypothetical protein
MTCYPADVVVSGVAGNVVVVGFSSVLTIAHKASGPSRLLLVACVIPGTAVVFRGVH